MLSPNPLFLVSINLLSEISTCLLHSGSSTKVGIRLPQVGWDHLVEREEKKEAGSRQEEQQAIVHEHEVAKCQKPKCQLLEMPKCKMLATGNEISQLLAVNTTWLILDYRG